MFYIDLFKSLAEHKVDYVLIGGLAVSLHGIERATMDIDITVALTPDNLSALISMCQSLQLKPQLPVPLEKLRDLPQLEAWHKERNLIAFALNSPQINGVTLDILLFPAVNFVDMYERKVTFKVADTPVYVASIDDLIALKLAAARPIDLSDIEHLKTLKSI